jgi:hypothetical protein
MTAVAIMQPTYLPWLGYIALMDRVDVFVYLDSVPFDRRSWQQRNRIRSAAGIQTLTVPVFKKGMRGQKIAEVRINRDFGFPEKHIRSIEAAYAKAPFFDRYAPELFERLRRPHEFLADLTIGLIDWIAATLGIETKRLRSSTLEATGAKADLLADICTRLGAMRYVSPIGSKDYLSASDAFDRIGVPVVYNEYAHPTYPQIHGAFEPYLSVIDLLFNAGPDSLEIIRRGQP